MSLEREILTLEQETLDYNSSGTFMQRLTNDTEKMSSIFTHGMVIIIKFLSAIGSFIAILIIDYHMFLYYFIASLILTILNYVKHEKVGEKDKEFRKESDKVAGLTVELEELQEISKSFMPKDNSNPYIGGHNKLEYVEEEKLEVICEVDKIKNIIKELRKVHPYEESAIDIIPFIDEYDFL